MPICWRRNETGSVPRQRPGRQRERRTRFFPQKEHAMIRKLPSGEYRLYSRKPDPRTGKRRNLGTFATRARAEKHEREIQFFKKH
jgi:hypothetical protein